MVGVNLSRVDVFLAHRNICSVAELPRRLHVEDLLTLVLSLHLLDGRFFFLSRALEWDGTGTWRAAI